MDSADDKQRVPPPPGDEETPAGGAPKQSAPEAPQEQAPAGTASGYGEVEGDYRNASYRAPGPPPAPPPPAPPPPSPPAGKSEAPDPEDDEEEGMLRMSFLEHLEELRKRILHALMGIGVAFALSLFFVDELWAIVQAPAIAALRANGIEGGLAMLTPTESFSVIWVKLPILTAVFLSSPWVGYQVWRFIAPGLYRRERRWAVPFIVSTAGLFVCGGLFAYFVAFRLGLAFLLGIGVSQDVRPVVSITEYFNLFVNVSLGLGLVFELPVLIFFLSLLRLVTPQFLLRNSRYAVLLIVVVAAIITPTPDVVNLMLISVPMALLYFTGVMASYLLWRSREKRRFPWMLILLVLSLLALVLGAGIWYAIADLGYQWRFGWPFLMK